LQKCFRALRRIGEPFYWLRTRHRLRAWRRERERQREELQATFDRIEREEMERQAEAKERDRYESARMSKREKVFRERWIRTPTGRKI
jgi:hypothetical protein